jgi:pilus assembly protein Flp/PilA
MSVGAGRHKPAADPPRGSTFSSNQGGNLAFSYVPVLTPPLTVQLTTDGSFGRKEAMKILVSRFISEEAGATAIEYGLLAALISVVIIGAVKVIGTSLNAGFNNIAGNLS